MTLLAADHMMFVAEDVARKQVAIKAARAAMVAMESFVEGAINHDPAPFTPQEAHGLRAELVKLGESVEEALDLLARETGNWADLNSRVAFLERRVDRVTKERDDSRASVTKLFNEKMAAERLVEELRGVEANGPDCG